MTLKCIVMLRCCQGNDSKNGPENPNLETGVLHLSARSQLHSGYIIFSESGWFTW